MKNWMTHDSRWSLAVTMEHGIEVTNRLNRFAVRELGKIESYRIPRALDWPEVNNLDDFILMNEVILSLAIPDEFNYQVRKKSDVSLDVQVEECFAYEKVREVGISGLCECGIFDRVMEWAEMHRMKCEIEPAFGACNKAHGRECIHTLTIKAA